MATLATDDPNIVDAEAVNWRLIVYPVLLVLIVVVGGLGYYYYHQHQIEQTETDARVALVKATTPEEFLKVAAQFPTTDQATLAYLAAADASFDKRDYPAALDAYRKVTDNLTVSAEIRDAAQLGIASVNEATGDVDKAIQAYMQVAQRGLKSPYAPYAFNSVARIDEQKGDKTAEMQVLQQAIGIAPNSMFTKQSQYKLNQLKPAAPPMTFNLPPEPNAPAPATQAPAAPVPVAPKPVAPANK